MSAQLDVLGSKPRNRKHSHKPIAASLPTEKQDLPIYDKHLSKPCLLHRFLGKQGEVAATHLMKECRIIKKIREGVASSIALTPVTPTSPASRFVGMIRSESILPVLDYDSDGCSSRGSTDSHLHFPPIEVYMAGTPAPGASVDAPGRPTLEALERAHQMLQAGTLITDQTSPGDLSPYRFIMKEPATQFVQDRVDLEARAR